MNRAAADAKIKALAARLIERGVASEDMLLGCTPGEIDEVEGAVGLPLPLVYRAWLARMGRMAGWFYQGTDMFYPQLLGLTNAAQRLVGEDQASLALPPDAIAFSMHQGYQFLFFRALEGDDPAVYYYMEGEGKFEKKGDSLSEFLLQVALDEW